jgi:hypothetical protein
VLTRNILFDVAHIYPYSRLKSPSTVGPIPSDFWKTLRRFWSDDRIQKWRNVIFPDQKNPDKGVETCYNLICLSPDAHGYWTKAYFALKPIQLSDDKQRLDVEFHWLPQYNYSPHIDILTSPLSPERSDNRSNIGLLHMTTHEIFYSGMKISLTTDDPVTRPLPHFALLEMQWILHRVTAMSGGAEIYEDFDNDDDDAMVVQNEWDSCEEDGWDSYIEDDGLDSYEEESPPTKIHDILMTQSSPPSSPPYQSPPSSLPKSNIRSDVITLRPAENSSIKIIDSPQGQ